MLFGYVSARRSIAADGNKLTVAEWIVAKAQDYAQNGPLDSRPILSADNQQRIDEMIALGYLARRDNGSTYITPEGEAYIAQQRLLASAPDSATLH